jgi:hypothetical protein
MNYKLILNYATYWYSLTLCAIEPSKPDYTIFKEQL